MTPVLFHDTEHDFTTNGIGMLTDTLSCSVSEKRNGEYELELEYPASGIHAENLVDRNIILAKPSDGAEPEPFRIYSVSTDLDGSIAVAARHISYELNFITASSVTGKSAITALESLKYSATTNCDFEFSTDIESNANMSITEPNSLRNILGGISGSIIDTFGGELEWNRYNVILHKERGTNRGVRISYGRNLEEFNMEKNSSDTFTGVHPYWMGMVDEDEDVLVELPEKVIMAEEAADYRIKVLDLSNEFDGMPSEDDLRSYAKAYLASSENTVPRLDISVGYEDMADETIKLCDTVSVYVSALDVDISMKVTETVYDVLLERYTSITLSNAYSSNTLAGTLSSFTDALVNKKLSYYVTTKEASTLLKISEGEILTKVSEVYATYAELVEYSDAVDGKIDTKLQNYYTISETQSYVKETVDTIESKVSSVTTKVETLENTAANLTSSITTIKEQYTSVLQDISSVTVSVSDLERTVGENYTSLQSQITANASSITAEVTRATAAEPKYGTCSTAASTAAKVVSCSTFTSLSAGATICVYFTYANTAASPTMNVNSTGAKSIYAYGAVLSSGSDYNWLAKSYVTFVYDGSHWCISDAASSLKIANLSLGITEFQGDIISYINASADVINLQGNRIIISSTNFTLSANGSITATGATISGTLTTTSGNYTSKLSGGQFKTYYDDDLYGVLGATTIVDDPTIRGYAMHGTGECKYIALGFADDTSASNTYYHSYLLNFGYNPHDYTERHIFYGTSRFDGIVHTNSQIYVNDVLEIQGSSSGASGLYNRNTSHWILYHDSSGDPYYYSGSVALRLFDYRTGSVSIKPSAANTPTAKILTFSTKMAGSPKAFATPASTVPGTKVLGVSVADVSSTGLSVYLTRTNTDTTGVHWIAIYDG